jgi:hypothetical protein
MLTKVSIPIPNKYTTNQINEFVKKFNKESNPVDKIQDNLEGYLLVKYLNGDLLMYNYYLNRFYSHNRIQVYWDGCKITKQIESFDQNNLKIASKIRSYVLGRIVYFNQYDFNFGIKSILGIGGEYYLYWIQLNWVKELIGLSNHLSIITDAKSNIPWSSNHLVDYNCLKSYPKICSCDIVLVNLFQINSNVINYIKQINWKKIIIIACTLPDSKLKLLAKNFKITKIKYYSNNDGIIRIIELDKK